MYTAKSGKSAKPRRWSVTEGRRDFAKLLRSVAKGPQSICRRDERVAVAVDAGTFAEFTASREARAVPTLAQWFEEARKICAEENYELEIPPRIERDSGFVVDDLEHRDETE